MHAGRAATGSTPNAGESAGSSAGRLTGFPSVPPPALGADQQNQPQRGRSGRPIFVVCRRASLTRGVPPRGTGWAPTLGHGRGYRVIDGQKNMSWRSRGSSLGVYIELRVAGDHPEPSAVTE